MDETVGDNFEADLLIGARDKTLAVILEAARRVRPGLAESEAKELVRRIQAEMGSAKSWHPPQIRFGGNTALAFGEKGLVDPVLQDNDIFFFDLGPIFDGHEGDVGRTFSVGNDAVMQKCCRDVEQIWHEVRQRWLDEGLTGEKLYLFARRFAEEKGWLLSLKKADGHRIADFPHVARKRGSVEGFKTQPMPNRWILEIQIQHPDGAFGAFYEDLLN